MDKLGEILQVAAQRANALGVPYTGAITPFEAFDLMQANKDAVLVDVRSRAELELVGRIPFAAHVEWAFYPGMVANAHFATELQAAVDKEATIVFMCRAGGRSHSAALVAQSLGYTNVFNMLEGFEGDANADKQRTLLNGWKHAGLPWTN